ncbi:probable cyclin-dependent serine/threonine-protein kinase DDB_G0292550 [Agrilus planipennis]|uniref:Probable cyclin-dependent serine/threonine-protein kinase DDB_G0292550 n=1 Tax=Agrilus planipennis TaxID=224129 RepID=A0A1W4WCS0_AGRPL|nr:probable cyclin-dependent serine/threonine-protein kinase DDB_G0292550 [Agrilus planipennis]
MLQNGSDRNCINNNLLPSNSTSSRNDTKERNNSRPNILIQNGCDFNRNYETNDENGGAKREEFRNKDKIKCDTDFQKRLTRDKQSGIKLTTKNVNGAKDDKIYLTKERRNESSLVNSMVVPSKKGRNSFHQDVDEALNSLLWQPYEYQAKQINAGDNISPSSSLSSSFCSCCSLSSVDLDGNTDLNNRASLQVVQQYHHHRQQRNSNNNIADLHLGAAAEMVNNLASCRNRLNQWQEPNVGSRDGLQPTVVAASRLSSAATVSCTSAFCPRGFVAGACGTASIPSSVASRCYCDARVLPVVVIGDMRVEVPLDSSSRSPDVSGVVQATTAAAAPAIVANGNNVPPASSSVARPSTYQNNSSGKNASNGQTVIDNMVSANVVGLPSNHHPRQSSVPNNHHRNGAFPFAHPRNLSEPSVAITHTRQSSNPSSSSSIISHQRNRSTPSMVATVEGSMFTTNYGSNGPFVAHASTPSAALPSHGRPVSGHITNNMSMLNSYGSRSVPNSTSSFVNCVNSMTPQERNANIVSILNHQRHSSFTGLAGTDNGGSSNTNANSNGSDLMSSRSASVPKTLVVQKPGESSITTLNVGVGPNNHSTHVPSSSSSSTNISNVDVNFYRAVPCNVVSNLPTIHCINSSSISDSGNNVSNVNIVQAMPQSVHQTAASSSTSGSTFLSANSPKHITTVAQINGNTSVNRTFGSTVTTQVTVHNESISTQNLLSLTPTTSGQNALDSQRVPAMAQQEAQRVQVEPRTITRTFTSTEAQTDDISVGTALVPARDRAASREQRRRERRERRHHRRLNSHHQHNNENNQQNVISNNNNNGNGNNHYVSMQTNDRLPDILNSHMPPPYSPVLTNLPTTPVVPTIVPPNVLTNNVVPVPSVVGNHAVPFPPPVVPGQVPLVQGTGPVPVAVPAPSGFRFPFPTTGFRRSRFSEESPKGCCSFLTWRPGSLRWFIALIALVAVCCVLVGTALGAMRPAGRDHLTVSLLMIGVGIVLVTVSGVAWRLTSHDSSTCRAMLGMGSTESVDTCPRRFVPRLPPSYGRPHHPYAAMMYPEFQYRPPPPSYQASMQEYRLRLLLLDRGNAAPAGAQNGASPPPTYRSHAGSLLRAPLSNRRDLGQSEYSFPPSYRSQTSSSRPATIDQLNNALHSREQSLTLSDSNHGGSVVNNVNILANTEEDIALDNITIDSLKMAPEGEINPVKMLLKGGSSDLDNGKDGNLVTIVQTGDQNPVIVTVSGCSQSENNTSNVQITEIPSEMEILAHL